MLMVLWVIALLSFLMVTTLMIAMQDVEAGVAREMISRARHLAESGLAIGCHQQIETGDPLLRTKPDSIESIEVQITSEEARLNINHLLTDAHRAVLERLFASWGLSQVEAESVVDALMDFVDEDDFKHLKGAESSDYKARDLPHGPANRPFRSLDEMLLVPGMDRVMQAAPRWREAFTLWGDGRLNLNEAEPALIAAVLDVPLTSAQNFTRHRDGLDGHPCTLDDNLAEELEEVYVRLGLGRPSAEGIGELVGLNGYTPRVVSIGRVNDCARGIAVTLQRRDGKTQVLAWHEFVPSTAGRP